MDIILVVTLLLILVSFLITYMKKCFMYWEKRKIPSLEGNIPFGSLRNPITYKKTLGIQYRTLYEQLKQKGVRYGGVYSFLAPVFVPIDPEITKLILAKDFRHFHSRGFYFNEKDQPISAHLFTIEGDRWKNLRTKLTPTFTTGKMKSMFEIVLTCGRQMEKEVYKYALESKPLDAKEFTSFYTTDVIGSCAFGIDCNSFKDPETVIFTTLRYAMNQTNRLLKSTFLFSFQNLSKQLKLLPFPKDSVDYFTKFMLDTVSYREKNRVIRGDFLQLLINLKNQELDSNSETGQLSLDEIISQSFLFFLAGFDTSSTTMSFSLFELGQHPHIQQKAREEINEVLAKRNGQLTYDSISEMKYLRQIVDETLRKYPPLPLLHRKCYEQYEIPGTDDTLEEGTQVIVPIMGIHYDPEFYPDPETFDPDRFTEEKKKQMDPYTYLPFGEGPRHCIGLRFGVMTTMAGLSVLLKNFSFTLNEKTVLPMEFNGSLLLQFANDILLDVKLINE